MKKTFDSADSIKEQIEQNSDILNSMPIVGSASVERVDVSKQGWKRRFSDELFAFYKIRGNNVKRSNFGTIEIPMSSLANALRYIKTEGEAVAFFVAHYVLRHGTIIYIDENHKGRGFDTVTFAAPVAINGIRGNMAVVIKSAEKKRYKVHRIMTPDGNTYSIESDKSKTRKGMGIADQGQSNPTTYVSDENNISHVKEEIKPYVNKQGKNLQEYKTSYIHVTGFPLTKIPYRSKGKTSLYYRLSNGPYFIAEMSANHAGSLENALEIVRAAKDAGADCLKIQTYTADTLTIDCDSEHFLIKGGLWDGYKLYDLYKEAFTPWEWQPRIKEECKRVGLEFLSTPFDNTAVDFLEDMGIEFYKIASFELVDIPLIEYAASKGKPMIISCGMGSIDEIQDALDACRRQGNEQIVLLKCTSNYPAVPDDMNLATITDMQERFNVPIGLSDHSMGSFAAVVAVSLGACVIEKHFCLSRKIKNPDSEFSMEPNEFAQMVEDSKAAARVRGNVCYELTEKEKASIVFRKSLFAVNDIAEGETFTAENVRSIRPGYGIAPKHYCYLLGKPAWRNYVCGEPIAPDEIE